MGFTQAYWIISSPFYTNNKNNVSDNNGFDTFDQAMFSGFMTLFGNVPTPSLTIAPTYATLLSALMSMILAIVMLNALIALMSDTFAKARELGLALWRREQATIVFEQAFARSAQTKQQQQQQYSKSFWHFRNWTFITKHNDNNTIHNTVNSTIINSNNNNDDNNTLNSTIINRNNNNNNNNDDNNTFNSTLINRNNSKNDNNTFNGIINKNIISKNPNNNSNNNNALWNVKPFVHVLQYTSDVAHATDNDEVAQQTTINSNSNNNNNSISNIGRLRQLVLSSKSIVAPFQDFDVEYETFLHRQQEVDQSLKQHKAVQQRGNSLENRMDAFVSKPSNELNKNNRSVANGTNPINSNNANPDRRKMMRRLDSISNLSVANSQNNSIKSNKSNNDSNKSRSKIYEFKTRMQSSRNLAISDDHSSSDELSSSDDSDSSKTDVFKHMLSDEFSGQQQQRQQQQSADRSYLSS